MSGTIPSILAETLRTSFYDIRQERTLSYQAVVKNIRSALQRIEGEEPGAECGASAAPLPQNAHQDSHVQRKKEQLNRLVKNVCRC